MENIYNQLTLRKHNYIEAKFTPIKMINFGKCLRCGNRDLTINNGVKSCLNCQELGLIDQFTYFYTLPFQNYPKDYQKSDNNLLLTKMQIKASSFIVNQLKTNKNCLIWAVCGAGKTEITFQAIECILQKKLFIGFAIPRIDVLYDVYDRLKQYFKLVEISLLHGQKKINKNAQIYVLTTNQLLNFKDAFDLLIIDEVDAFPYEYNQKFEYATKTSTRKNGSIVYLTSTPSKVMLEKQLPTFVISKRWHNYLLPVPKLEFLNYKLLKNYILSPYILYLLLKLDKQLIIFISNISLGYQISKVLNFYNFKNTFVHSKAKHKRKYINAFKDQKINILISTTILERGVTFKNIDVWILDSSSSLYNIASLVQIAGRVNRNINFQNGQVIFFYTTINKTITEAIKQIKYLNNL